MFVSQKEEATLADIIDNIHSEHSSNIDKYSQSIIISQIETLLNYSERFFNRQFITRKKANHQLLDRLETILASYLNSVDLIHKGLPGVSELADQLNVSPKYLSSLLKVLTGQTAQQHIHEKVIEKAKEHLSATDLSVSVIAYQLGFEHPQSFSKFFKTKTNMTPLAFREAFKAN